MKKLFYIILLMPIAISLYSQDIIPGEVLLQFENKISLDQQKQILENSGLEIIHQLSVRLHIWHCRVKNQHPEKEILDNLQKTPGVKFAQYNHRLELRENIPDDEYFSSQWCHQNTGQSGGLVGADMDSPSAWDVHTGGITATGDRVVLAIVDNGTDLDHPDLNFFKNVNEIPDNEIDDDNNGYIDDYDGWNAYNHTGDPGSGSHGAHCCGISAALGNNGLGVCGVNWGAQIMPVTGSSSSEATVVEAYGYVLEMRSSWNESGGEEGAFVVATNSSFGVNYGEPADYPIWSAMYDSLGYVGVLSAAATMNNNSNVDETSDMPTACSSPWLISVTNTTDEDEKNGSAAYGQLTIDLGAPGTGIYSTDINISGYSYKTGTSMATPQVTGAIGLVFSSASAIFIQEYINDPAGMALLVKDIILDSVDPIPDLTGYTVSGGRLNLEAALELLRSAEYGDIDDNGGIESLDASLTLQYMIGLDPTPAAPLPWEFWRKNRADVDGNGSIEAFDSSLILRFVVGMINQFPVEE